MGKLSRFLAVLFLLFAATACLDVEEPEPEDPVEQMEDLMVGAQYYMSEWLSSDFARYPLMWTQQISGVRGSHLQAEVYNSQATNFNESWQTFYMDLMQRLYLIEFVAEQHDAPVYQAISYVLQAFATGMATDAWGDIPITEISKYYTYEQNPRYDDQDDVYVRLFSILDEAIMLLETEGMHPVRPATGVDFFYRGDTGSWLRAARLLKLKFSLRMGHLSGSYAQSLQLVEQGGLMSGAADDMVFPYGEINGVDNPWALFDFHTGNTRVGELMVGLLQETDDPRLPRYVRMTTDNEYVGAAPGSMNLNTSRLANTSLSIAHADRRFVLLSYAEQKYIEAEVYHRQGLQAMADEAYNQGVIASLAMQAARSEGWESEHASVEQVGLEQIITGKYIALFLNPEVWTDWRRTGYPVLVASAGNLNDDQIPRRFLYPTSEMTQNAANVPADVTLNTRVWWDE